MTFGEWFVAVIERCQEKWGMFTYPSSLEGFLDPQFLDWMNVRFMKGRTPNQTASDLFREKP